MYSTVCPVCTVQLTTPSTFFLHVNKKCPRKQTEKPIMPLSLKEKRDLLHGGNEHPPKHQQHANNAYTRTYIDRTIHI